LFIKIVKKLPKSIRQFNKGSLISDVKKDKREFVGLLLMIHAIFIRCATTIVLHNFVRMQYMCFHSSTREISRVEGLF